MIDGMPNPLSPEMQGVAPRTKASHAWRVVHAAPAFHPLLEIAEAQLACGMRPFIVTPESSGEAASYLHSEQAERALPSSLMQAWNDVRDWRRNLLDACQQTSAEIVHAHTFSAGMAAVRSCPAVVYDILGFVEELAAASGQCEPGSWMARSFRVAEQFVLSRAGAVVSHSNSMREACVARGAQPEDIFVVPLPLERHWLESSDTRTSFLLDQDCVLLAAPDAYKEGDAFVEQLLAAMVVAHGEVPDIRLALCGDDDVRGWMEERAHAHGLDGAVLFFPPSAKLIGSVDIVIAGPRENAIRLPNPTALAAMAAGSALLSADLPINRDASPDGRGCIWFRAGGASDKERDAAVKDLAYRAAFLARNADFRRSLGEAGRKYVARAYGHEAIGEALQKAYRHAHSRRKSGAANPPIAGLEPSMVCM